MSRKPLWEQHRSRLEKLRDAAVNFDPEQSHEYTQANGWHIDEYEGELPSEPPGPPIEHGAWQSAREIIREYKFPDPKIVTGIYFPAHPIEGRVMVLQARFLFLSFYFGVRVGGITDGERETDEGPTRVWGFNYQTLEGHFEQGQMTFEVVKWVETGKVAFQIHAFSRTGHIRNPFFRIGFKLFGRKLQRAFAQRSLERMQQLVKEELATSDQKTTADAPPVQPASADQKAEQTMQKTKEQVEEGP